MRGPFSTLPSANHSQWTKAIWRQLFSVNKATELKTKMRIPPVLASNDLQAVRRRQYGKKKIIGKSIVHAFG